MEKKQQEVMKGDEQLQGDHTSKMQETQWASGNCRRSEKGS